MSESYEMINELVIKPSVGEELKSRYGKCVNMNIGDKVELTKGYYKGWKATIEKITDKGIKVRIIYDTDKNTLRINTIEGLKEDDLKLI